MLLSRKAIKLYITRFWNKTLQQNSLSKKEKLLFCFLKSFELLYLIGFRVVVFFKKTKTRKVVLDFKTIAVGNLSVGGTGKSVVTSFLIKNLSFFSGAVVLRGYQGQNAKTDKSFLVSDGANVFGNATFCGDEAVMFARSLRVPVVVGKNRAVSCALLRDVFCSEKKPLDFVVLDDAYQNFQVKKDLQILLLDARFPFENGHCLPAGRLREKDYCRADFIFLTHADEIEAKVLQEIKTSKLKKFSQEKIFCVKHQIVGISHLDGKKKDTNQFTGQRFFLCAGIGSFAGFMKSAKKIGVEIFDFKEYPDHCNYTKDDIVFCVKQAKKDGLQGVLTTQKDWVKMFPLIQNVDGWQDLPIYVAHVDLAFLCDKRKAYFLDRVKKKLV